MKTRRHFIFTKIKETVSRTYGGANYTLALYENKGKGSLVRLGETSACTRAHKGESHEAWTAIFHKLSKRDQNSMLKHPAIVEQNARQSGGHFPQYHDRSALEKMGIVLTEI